MGTRQDEHHVLPGGKENTYQYYYQSNTNSLIFSKVGIPKYQNILRIDYCDEHVIQESSYISGAIRLIHTYYISYEAQYFSELNHTSKIEMGHKLSE